MVTISTLGQVRDQHVGLERSQDLEDGRLDELSSEGFVADAPGPLLEEAPDAAGPLLEEEAPEALEPLLEEAATEEELAEEASTEATPVEEAPLYWWPPVLMAIGFPAFLAAITTF